MGKTTLSQAVKKIKNVEIQGAREIALFSLKSLSDIAKRHGFGKEFKKASRKLDKARPTAVVLHNCLEIINRVEKLDSIDNLIEKLESSDDKIVEAGIKLFRKKRYKILTHCHSSEAISLIKGLKREKKSISVIVTKTDPLEQGVKTAKELSKARIPITLIIDSAVGHFIDDVDVVIVGTDAIRKEGVVNKIGTKLYSIAAKEHKKPVYVVGNILKLDRRKKIEIEQRPVMEIQKELSKPYRLNGIKIENPAFDITPWRYITKIVTDEGVFTPSQIKRMLK